MVIRSVGYVVGVCCLFAAGPAWGQGFGGALLFDGIDDVVTIPDDSGHLDLGSSLTIEVWVRPESIPSGYSAFLKGGSGYKLFTGTSGDGSWGLSISNPGTDSAVSPPGNLTVGERQHLAATYDGTTMTIYRNGQLVGSHAHSSPGPSLGVPSVILGTWVEYIDGTIDDVRIWSIVRDQGDIQATMNQPLTGNETGLAAYWRLDSIGGQTVIDSTVNGTDGYLGDTTGADSSDPMWTMIFWDGFESGNLSGWSTFYPGGGG